MEAGGRLRCRWEQRHAGQVLVGGTSAGVGYPTDVREFRRQQGLTVVAQASRGELSRGMLSKIENVQAAPSLGYPGPAA